MYVALSELMVNCCSSTTAVGPPKGSSPISDPVNTRQPTVNMAPDAPPILP
jgi:hypothetical protein